MMILKSKWKCCECGELHEHEDDALDCCPPEVREVYVCPICTKDHNQQIMAFDCCDFDPDVDVLPPPSAAELEAAGQMRLLP